MDLRLILPRNITIQSAGTLSYNKENGIILGSQDVYCLKDIITISRGNTSIIVTKFLREYESRGFSAY